MNWDYHDLMSRPISLDPARKQVKISILSEGSTDHFIHFLNLFLIDHKITAEIKTHGLNTIEQEVLDPRSSYHQFQAEFTLILTHAWNLPDEFSPETTAEKWASLWKSLPVKTITLQTNYSSPAERVSGNYDFILSQSAQNRFAELNRLLKAEPGNIQFIDVDYLASYYGKRQWFDFRMWTAFKYLCPLEFLPSLAKAFAERISAILNPPIKAVVLDLDNTLWSGIVGEVGFAGIEFSGSPVGEAYHRFQLFLKKLKTRGIILTVVSKNDPETAKSPFASKDMVLKLEDIACFKAAWSNKHELIREISDELKISPQSMIFIDDSSYERSMVKNFLPEIIVPEMPEDISDYVSFLSENNFFEVSSITEEDIDRPESYRVESRRTETAKNFKSVKEFLNSLKLESSVSDINDSNLSRVAQLYARTNQFNLSHARKTEAELRALLTDTYSFTRVFSLRDSHGQYGLIGAIHGIQKKSAFYLEDFLLSCRAIGRTMEMFMLNSLVENLKAKNISILRAHTKATSKNAPFLDFYKNAGFRRINENEWEINLADYVPQETAVGKS